MKRLQDVIGKSLRDPVKRKFRGVLGPRDKRTHWKILAEPPAASRPVLTPSATVDKDMSERRGLSER